MGTRDPPATPLPYVVWLSAAAASATQEELRLAKAACAPHATMPRHSSWGLCSAVLALRFP